MPDPALYTAVLLGATISSLLLIVVGRRLLVGSVHRGATAASQAAAVPRGLVIGAMLIGLVVGFGWLKGVPRWPPRQAFDRLLIYIFPLLILLELFVARAQQARRLWQLRTGPYSIRGVMHGVIALLIPVLAIRILLHGSIYLHQLTLAQSILYFSLMLLVSIIWLVLAWVLDELAADDLVSSNTGIGLALIAALLACSATMMLTGYVTGGAAAMPFVGVILGAMMGVPAALGRRPDVEVMRALVSVGFTGLMMLVLLGWLFGGLSTWQSVVLLFSPGLLALPRWLMPMSETAGQQLRRVCKRRMISGLLLVAVLLGVLVFQAKREFDRKYEPLRFRGSGLQP